MADELTSIGQIERDLLAIDQYQRRLVNRRPALPDLEAPGTRISRGVLRLLQAVQDTRGEATVGSMAVVLVLDSSQTSRLTDQAVSAGLVTRETSDQDGRRCCLKLTAKGAAVVARMKSYRRGDVVNRLVLWNAEDRATFARLLHRFVEACK